MLANPLWGGPGSTHTSLQARTGYCSNINYVYRFRFEASNVEFVTRASDGHRLCNIPVLCP